MKKQSPDSACLICGSEYSEKGMTRHVKSCLKKELMKRPASQAAPVHHLHITGSFNWDYFLHLLVTGDTTLGNLDRYLRDIWLECCGHLSGFFERSRPDELDMRTPIQDAFVPNPILMYQYDFGSTTELTVRSLNQFPGSPGLVNKINLISRNAPLAYPCDECGKYPVVVICDECQWDGGGWLCKRCAEKHDCENGMLMPLVNSPRAGVCAYTGNDNDDEFVGDIFIEYKEPLTKSIPIKPGTKKGKQAPTGREKRKKRGKPDIDSIHEDALEQRVAALKEMVRFFCNAHLNREYEGYTLNLVDTLIEHNELNIVRGKIEIWAAAALVVIGRLNFLFDKENDDYITAAAISSYFGTRVGTVSNKASQIELACDLEIGDERFCTREIVDATTLVETPHGFVFPKMLLDELKVSHPGLLDTDSELELLEKLLEIAGDHVPASLRNEAEAFLEGDVDNSEIESTLELFGNIKRQKKAERQQRFKEKQKIAESEQAKIDDGQISIFDES